MPLRTIRFRLAAKTPLHIDAPGGVETSVAILLAQGPQGLQTSLPALVIRPFVFGLDPRPEPKTSAEVAASYWIPLASLAGAQTTSLVAHRGKSIAVPSFKIAGLPEGLVVWGLTYRILNGLLPLL